MTTPDNVPEGSWFWIPIIRDPDVSQQLETILNRLDQIMAQVKVDSQALVDLDTALDEVAQSLSNKIASLQLPDADLQPLLDDVATLRGLSAPAPVEEPPA